MYCRGFSERQLSVRLVGGDVCICGFYLVHGGAGNRAYVKLSCGGSVVGAANAGCAAVPVIRRIRGWGGVGRRRQ